MKLRREMYGKMVLPADLTEEKLINLKVGDWIVINVKHTNNEDYRTFIDMVMKTKTNWEVKTEYFPVLFVYEKIS